MEKITYVQRTKNEKLRMAFAVSVFCIYVFYLFFNVNVYLSLSLSNTWYAILVPILVAGTLYFCPLWERWEFRLIVIYYAWYVLSRMLCGDPTLSTEYLTVLHVSLMIPLIALGMTLTQRERKIFMDWLSGVVGGFYFLLGCVCIYSFLLRIDILNPISQQMICSVKSFKVYPRLNVLDINTDSTAFWLMSSFLLMVYQFFACKNKLWRVPIVVSAAVDYVVMALINTRSVMASVAVALGLLAVLLLYERLSVRKAAVKAAILVLAFLIVTPAVYLSFDPLIQGVGKLSIQIRYADQSDAEKEELLAQKNIRGRQLANKDQGLNAMSNGRIMIYMATVDAVLEDPSILLRGSLDEESADQLTEILLSKGLIQEGKYVPHYQNYLIQTLMITGVPGFVLVLAFSIMLVIKCIRMFFDRGREIPLPVKVLILPIAASLIYEMFEIGIFTAADQRTNFFFVISGMFLGWDYEYFKDGKKAESVVANG